MRAHVAALTTAAALMLTVAAGGTAAPPTDACGPSGWCVKTAAAAGPSACAQAGPSGPCIVGVNGAASNCATAETCDPKTAVCVLSTGKACTPDPVCGDSGICRTSGANKGLCVTPVLSGLPGNNESGTSCTVTPPAKPDTRGSCKAGLVCDSVLNECVVVGKAACGSKAPPPTPPPLPPPNTEAGCKSAFQAAYIATVTGPCAYNMSCTVGLGQTYDCKRVNDSWVPNDYRTPCCQYLINRMLTACKGLSFPSKDPVSGKTINDGYSSFYGKTLRQVTVAHSCNWIGAYPQCKAAHCSTSARAKAATVCGFKTDTPTKTPQLCTPACSNQFWQFYGNCFGCPDAELRTLLPKVSSLLQTCKAKKSCPVLKETIHDACCVGDDAVCSKKGVPPNCANPICATIVRDGGLTSCPKMFLDDPDWEGFYKDCGGDLFALNQAAQDPYHPFHHWSGKKMRVPLIIIYCVLGLCGLLLLCNLSLLYGKKKSAGNSLIEPISTSRYDSAWSDDGAING